MSFSETCEYLDYVTKEYNGQNFNGRILNENFKVNENVKVKEIISCTQTKFDNSILSRYNTIGLQVVYFARISRKNNQKQMAAKNKSRKMTLKRKSLIELVRVMILSHTRLLQLVILWATCG